MKKYVKCIIIITLICVLGVSSVFIAARKPDIRKVDKCQIEEIDGIGQELAERIQGYCIKNNADSVKKLHPGEIKRVGVKTIAKLKKKFK